LPVMVRDTKITDSCMGRGMQAAHRLISTVGGKIILIQACLPNVGIGGLKRRFEAKHLGTPKESDLLHATDKFYREFAISCSPDHVSVDAFLFSHDYVDLATISTTCRYTGGSVYFYPRFDAQRREDAVKFSAELEAVLTKPVAAEAVLRARASRNVRIIGQMGSFFLRAMDLVSLSSVNPDCCVTIELAVEEDLPNNCAYFQAALLHTSPNGRVFAFICFLVVNSS
jgi:protein transport protein SEC24